MKKKKKNKIHEMNYHILYNYKRVLEAIVSNFFPFVDDNTASFFASNNNFSISVISRICIRSFVTGR